MHYFDTFHHEIILTGEINLVTGLHIGRGSTGLFGTDDEVVKTPDGSPYIPGSSLKGVLRAALERISSFPTLPRDGYASPCISTDKDGLCLDTSPISKVENRQNMSAQQIADKVAQGSCPLCHLFGNKMMAGKVQFFDASVVKQSWINQYDYRDGVGIDRDTGTAKEGVKYDFEVVPAGTAFHFRVRALNLAKPELQWLLVGLELLRQGEITLGGKVTRGLGRVAGSNWEVIERTPDTFLRSLFHSEQTAVPFSDYVQSHIGALLEGEHV